MECQEWFRSAARARAASPPARRVRASGVITQPTVTPPSDSRIGGRLPAFWHSTRQATEIKRENGGDGGNRSRRRSAGLGGLLRDRKFEPVLLVHSPVGRKKIRRLLAKARQRRGGGWKRSHGWVYTGTNGETRDTDKAKTSRTTAPALDPTRRRLRRRAPVGSVASDQFGPSHRASQSAPGREKRMLSERRTSLAPTSWIISSLRQTCARRSTILTSSGRSSRSSCSSDVLTEVQVESA
jgi:hypothetical protein